jgi:hypothetical protein
MKKKKKTNKKSGVSAPLFLNALLQQWTADGFRKPVVPVRVGGRAVYVIQDNGGVVESVYTASYQLASCTGIGGSNPLAPTPKTFQTWKPRSPQRQRDFRNRILTEPRHDRPSLIYRLILALSREKLESQNEYAERREKDGYSFVVGRG